MYVYIFSSGEEQDLRIRSLYLYHCCSLHYFHHSLASGKTTRREHSPAHQQKIRLRIYWAWPCSSEQDPVSPSVSLSHQEASISLLSLSVRKSEVPQSCLNLCDPIDCSLPASSVHGIFQARVLEWVAFSFSRGSSQPRDWTQVSHIAGRCFTVWATREALLSVWEHKMKATVTEN